MNNTRDIQRRIKSIRNTKKITRAMEMVAASKMRRSVEAVLKTRTYANLSWMTILNLSRASYNGSDYIHPLLKKNEKTEKIVMILITSNRGLCGSYNSAIINKAHQSIIKHHQEAITDFILIGKRGGAVHKYFGYNVIAEFSKMDTVNEIKNIIPISKMIINDFLNKKYDKVFVAYTDFVSALKQIPRVKQLLPIDIEAPDEFLGIVGMDTRLGTTKKMIATKEEKHLIENQFKYEYLFEPSPQDVLNEMIPRLVEVQLYQALLESNASEHSARMLAMRQATDAAGTMIDELTIFYNKARQASITAEIAEIATGANALN